MPMNSLQLVFEAAYLHARQLFGATLGERETQRLGLLSAMLAGEGRRRFLRVPVDCEATLNQGDQHYSARVVDLSAGGCLVKTTATLSRGTPVRLTIECDESRRIFTGVVCRHAGDAGGGVALRFTAIPLELRLAARHPSLFDALEAVGAAS